MLPAPSLPAGFPMRLVQIACSLFLAFALTPTSFAQEAPACPRPVTPLPPPIAATPATPSGSYSLTLEKDNQSMASASTQTWEDRPAILTMVVPKNYVSGHSVGPGGVVEVTSGKVNESLTLSLTVSQPAAAVAQAYFEIKTTTVARIESRGMTQVPILEDGGPVCGTLSFQVGQSRRFIIQGSSLTATVKRER